MRAAGWLDLYTRLPNCKGSCRESHHGPPRRVPRAMGPTPKRVRLGSQGCFTGCVARMHFALESAPTPRAARVPPRAFYYTPGAACVLRIVCRDVAPTAAHVLGVRMYFNYRYILGIYGCMLLSDTRHSGAAI
jgi:hypothetical protein